LVRYEPLVHSIVLYLESSKNNKTKRESKVLKSQ